MINDHNILCIYVSCSLLVIVNDDYITIMAKLWQNYDDVITNMIPICSMKGMLIYMLSFVGVNAGK